MGHIVRGLLLSKTHYSYNYDNVNKSIKTYENEHLPYTPEEGDIYVYPSVGRVELYKQARAKYENDASWRYLSFMHQLKHNLCFRNTAVGIQAAINQAKAMLQDKNDSHKS